MNEILVSISMMAYNHEAFIAKAIESIMMQKTNFPYQLVLSEDCSTDGTREICINYKNRFPEKIKLILNEKNIGPTKNAVNNLTNCTGKFIAVCEGDDYWTDPLKLQKQVDFLNDNPQFTICFTNSTIVDKDDNIVEKEKVPAEHKKNHNQREIIEGFCPPVNTVLFRNGLITEFPKEYLKVVNADYFLYSLLTKFGDAGYLDENTAAYRRHSGGIWSQKSEEHKMRGYLQTCEALLEYFGRQYEDILTEHIKGAKKELEKYKTTEKLKDISISSPEGNSMTDLINEAKELISKGNLEDAKDLCYEILSEETLCDDAYFLLGEINYASADFELALRNYQSAYEISKTRLDAAVNLVISYISLNRFPEAIKFLKKVTVENPYNQNLLLICRELKVNIEWEDLKNLSPVRLYAGDIPETEEYKNLIGLSIEKNDHRHLLHDMTKPLPLEDNSVDSFQSEDVFEHIAYEKLPAVINEIYRVLKPGAVFRLSIPDYGCDILYNRSIKDANGKITFDPDGGGTIENPGHVWFPNINNVRALLSGTKFAQPENIYFLHYYNDDGTYQLKPIDYSIGFVKRNPDNDKRVQNPRRPMSLIVDLVKSEVIANQVDSNITPVPFNNETKNDNIEPKLSFVMIVLNGMPFIEYSLKAIYKYAHEIIIVEGAVENCLFAANEDGSSKDGTVEFIHNFPDPDRKIRLIQGSWPEKMEMQNKALEYVTGNYVWLVDSDEVYKGKDIETISAMLKNDPSITQVNFIPDNFWKGYDYIFVSPFFFESEAHYRRLFKYQVGAKFTTHRPPTMLLPGINKTTEEIHLVDGTATRKMGIYPYHYSYVLEKQVSQKTELYNRYGWGKAWNIDMNLWFKECYVKWTPENREDIEAKYPVWTGGNNSHTQLFQGEHPEVIKDFISLSKLSAFDRAKISYKDIFNKFTTQLPEYSAVVNAEQDNGSVILLKNITPEKFLEADAPVKKKIKIAGQDETEKNLTQIDSVSVFATEINKIISKIRPSKIIETGTFHGTGTTTIIASALKNLGLTGSRFFSIEVNTNNHLIAAKNITESGLADYVTLLNGLSLPRTLLPNVDEIEKTTVKEIEFEDIFVDHKETDRAKLYYNETNFDNVDDDLLDKCLITFDYEPDFVLLDSGGHIGNLEFNYLIEKIKKDCVIGLDDINHIKHRKSFLQIQNDPRFEVIIRSDEKFGFCLARFSPLKNKKNRTGLLDEIKPENILFLRTDAVGDNVLASSLVREIKNNYSKAEITVLCQHHVAELYEHCPYVKKIIRIDKKKFLEDEKYKGKLILTIQKEKFDLVINSVYSSEPINDLIAFTTGAKQTIRIDGNIENSTQEWVNDARKFSSFVINTGAGWRSETDRHKDFLTGMGIDVTNILPEFWLSKEDEKFADRYFTNNGLIPEKTIILFAGARINTRLYNQYGKALAKICSEHKFSIISVGSFEDFKINQDCINDIKTKTFNLSGKTTLRQTAALIKKCRMVVGAETGNAHIACAVGTPNVIILGGGHFGRFMPYSKLTTAVSLPMDCYGCNWYCKYDKAKCVTEINYNTLYIAVNEALQRDSAKPRIIIDSKDNNYNKIINQFIEPGEFEIIDLTQSGSSDKSKKDINEAGIIQKQAPETEAEVNSSTNNWAADYTYSKKSHFNSFERFGNYINLNIDQCDLKAYQDLLIYNFIKSHVPKNSRLLEIGGGNSRVIEALKNDYECWNLDKFEGNGSGPTKYNTDGRSRIVLDYIGNFNQELPENYFDCVYSISTLEHVPVTEKTFEDIKNDISRVLKPGGLSFHCLDVVIKEDKIWSNDFLTYLFSKLKTLNCFVPFDELQKDKDLFVMSKAGYDLSWKECTGKTYEEFGRPASYNIFWQKNEEDQKDTKDKNININKLGYPKISIVTPSFNQGKYLDQCIDSILSQNYPNLEYLILDGGSKDGSVEIIKKYEKHLTYWQSQPDGGQYESIQAGLNKSTGEIMSWLNSDDKYHPNSLFKVADMFESHPSVEWICGRPTYLNVDGRLIGIHDSMPVWTREDFLNKKYDDPFIQQESTLWKRSLWNKAGSYLDPKYNLAGDLELWVRFFRYANLFSFDALIGGWRRHDDQKSSSQRSKYISQAGAIIENEVKNFKKAVNSDSNVQDTVIKYDKKQLENSGLNFSILREENCWKSYYDDIKRISNNAFENNRENVTNFLKSEFDYSFNSPNAQYGISNPNLTVEEKQRFINKLLSKAEEFLTEEKYLNALSILKEILRQEPNNINALNDYAVIELKRDNPDAAKKILEMALNLDKDNETAANNLNYLNTQLSSPVNPVKSEELNSLPTISVITPSFNQGKYIEQTIQSVMKQGYSSFEHIIIDGGSTDETIEILKKYPHLKWISEKDNGQSDALNKGFELASGEIIAWINSDDWYEPNTFYTVAKYFDENKYKNILMGNCNLVDEDGKITDCVINNERGIEELTDYRVSRSIPTQPAVFFRKKLLEESGLLDVNLQYVMDYDLWMRFAKKERFFHINQTFANYRFHKEAKIGDSNWEKIYPECEIVKQRYAAGNNNPLVSVIIPCYNYANYLSEAVNSVVNQTYTNWEIIIVNDGSTDNTIEKAMQLISANPGKRIKLVNQENSGKPAISRNRGIEESNGRYILPLDADDKLTPEALNLYIDAAYRSQDEHVVVFGWLKTFGDTSNLWQTRSFQLTEILHSTMLPYCSMFHRSVWQKNNGYATNVGYEDWDFWIGAAANGALFVNIPQVTTMRRETENTSRQKIDRRSHELNIAGIIINHRFVFEDEEIRWAEDYQMNCTKTSNGAAHKLAKQNYPVIAANLIYHYPALYDKQEAEWAKNYLIENPFLIRKGLKFNNLLKKNGPHDEKWVMSKVNLGVDNLKHNMNAEAIQHFDEVLRELPQLTEVRYGKAVALANLGQVKRAKNELEELLKIKPDYTAAREFLSKLNLKN